MARYYECTLCGAALKGVYALDDTYEICINCAEEHGILDRQVPVSRMVQQIRHQIAAEKAGKSTQDLHLTGSVQRLVPDGEVLDIRLREGLKDYYGVVSFFQEEEVRKCKSKYTMGFPTPEYANNERLQKALRVVISHCTTDEEFATWLARIKKENK